MELKRIVLQIGMGTDIRTTDHIFASRALSGPPAVVPSGLARRSGRR